MAQVLKIDANSTALLWAEEVSYKTLSGSEDWYVMEPNSYADFGAQTTLVARDPITNTRQRKKGAITGLDASGGFNHDLIQEDLQLHLQGFMFDDLRAHGEFSALTSVEAPANKYHGVGIEAIFPVGSLIKVTGLDDAANNSLHRVTASAANEITVAETLVADASPAVGSKVVEVGFQFASGDADIDVSGSLPKLTSSAKNQTDFDLLPGDYMWIGGDAAGSAFPEAVNNGLARVRSQAAGYTEFDWAPGHTFAAAAQAGLTVQVFFGRVLRNGIKTRSYHLERRLGAPDDAFPADVQAEYLIGALGNGLNWNIPAEGKATLDLTYVAADDEQVAAGDPLRSDASSGDIVPARGEQPFNTTSDVRSIKMAVYDPADENPTPLFAFVTDLTLQFSNNIAGLKAIGTLGNFAVSVGNFTVSGSLTAYFVDVASLQAVRDNADVTMSIFMAKENSGLVIDLPLLGLGDGRPTVEKDAAIKLPIKAEAASGAKLHADLDYTAELVFMDYLPDLAMA